MRKTALAGTGVGVPGVYHERAHRNTRMQMIFGDGNRRGTKAIAREHACNPCALRQGDQQEILAIGLAYAGREGAKLNTIDRTELFSGRGSEIDGHGGRDFSEV